MWPVLQILTSKFHYIPGMESKAPGSQTAEDRLIKQPSSHRRLIKHTLMLQGYCWGKPHEAYFTLLKSHSSNKCHPLLCIPIKVSLGKRLNNYFSLIARITERVLKDASPFLAWRPYPWEKGSLQRELFLQLRPAGCPLPLWQTITNRCASSTLNSLYGPGPASERREQMGAAKPAALLSSPAQGPCLF